MEKVNYDHIYSNYTEQHIKWIKETCKWKAGILCKLCDNIPHKSIVEIGTGRGDTLDAINIFEEKYGADISEEALDQHRKIYPDHKLIKIDADKPLPFDVNQFDCVLLCDILEHIEKPVELLKEASRVGSYVLLKIPVEKALLTGITRKLNKVKYGQSHPSGHLHCWNVNDIFKIIKSGSLKIVKKEFVGTPIELLKKGSLIKNIVAWFTRTCDLFFRGTFFTRNLIGGTFFVIAEKNKT